ncbi:hypothetical protein [Bartonella sp. CL29QHWL]|uniref:hypothetical protein n=1 Tax=Bartonella sp. CL29QHWL TaxID=3243522 RepID=UPI0035D00415
MRVPAGVCFGVPAEVRAGLPVGMCAGMPAWRGGWLRWCFGVPAEVCAGLPAGMCAWRRGLWGKGLANQIKSVHIGRLLVWFLLPFAQAVL